MSVPLADVRDRYEQLDIPHVECRVTVVAAACHRRLGEILRARQLAVDATSKMLPLLSKSLDSPNLAVSQFGGHVSKLPTVRVQAHVQQCKSAAYRYLTAAEVKEILVWPLRCPSYSASYSLQAVTLYTTLHAETPALEQTVYSTGDSDALYNVQLDSGFFPLLEACVDGFSQARQYIDQVKGFDAACQRIVEAPWYHDHSHGPAAVGQRAEHAVQALAGFIETQLDVVQSSLQARFYTGEPLRTAESVGTVGSQIAVTRVTAGIDALPSSFVANSDLNDHRAPSKRMLEARDPRHLLSVVNCDTAKIGSSGRGPSTQASYSLPTPLRRLNFEDFISTVSQVFAHYFRQIFHRKHAVSARANIFDVESDTSLRTRSPSPQSSDGDDSDSSDGEELAAILGRRTIQRRPEFTSNDFAFHVSEDDSRGELRPQQRAVFHAPVAAKSTHSMSGLRDTTKRAPSHKRTTNFRVTAKPIVQVEGWQRRISPRITRFVTSRQPQATKSAVCSRPQPQRQPSQTSCDTRHNADDAQGTGTLRRDFGITVWILLDQMVAPPWVGKTEDHDIPGVYFSSVREIVSRQLQLSCAG